MKNNDQAALLILALLSTSLVVPALAQLGGPTFQEFSAPGASITRSSVCANAFGEMAGCGTISLSNHERGVVVRFTPAVLSGPSGAKQRVESCEWRR
jgi:hypothetical protein